MGAEEHQPKQVVLDDVTDVGHDPRRRGLVLGVDDQQRLLANGDRLAVQPVDGPPSSRREQPGRRVGRHTVRRPVPGRRLERVGQRVLGEVEAAVLADEQRQQPAPVLPVCRVERRVRLHPSRLGGYPGWASVGGSLRS